VSYDVTYIGVVNVGMFYYKHFETQGKIMCASCIINFTAVCVCVCVCVRARARMFNSANCGASSVDCFYEQKFLCRQ
jgi:hypothetical protein